MDLGKVDLQEEMERRAEELYTPNWFSVELKTGVGGGTEGERERRGGRGRGWRNGWEGKGSRSGDRCACVTDVISK